ncbi:hypothetical protein GGI15_002894 [Coemansia interrupta]|uniref:NF-kappa-B-activating protein C-terminal domain-containing protein n=1 Tax=Coemansia interrupta TaxID=1126814 RepID=A0A9W8HFP2_9FUNG|nr:hypothetical protein GGI15_002894 [Coemansia interrupta]
MKKMMTDIIAVSPTDVRIRVEIGSASLETGHLPTNLVAITIASLDEARITAQTKIAIAVEAATGVSQRESVQLSIWAPSPTQSEDEDDRLEEEKIISQMQKRVDGFRDDVPESESDFSDLSADNDSDSDSESSSESERRSRKKSKKSKKSSRSSKSSRKSKSKSKRHESKSSSKRSKRKHEKGHRRSRRYSSDEESSDQSSDGYSDDKRHRRSRSPSNDRRKRRKRDEKTSEPDSDESDGEIGPVPDASADQTRTPASGGFGGALLPGEGSAMAAYVQSGERIPRRGEIGVDQDMIERLENSGYVMSGNRHKRMNAVRQRKEDQVISAEEKRKILLANQEERKNKEAQIISEFREMLSKKKK